MFKESGQKDAFVTHGYYGWIKKDKLGIHVGKPNSFHNKHFKNVTRKSLMIELGNYIIIMRKDGMFANVNGISNLSKRTVEIKKHLRYTLLYHLLNLALILPVARTGVERCFSSMKHVKTDLRNRMGDEYMNDCCICYIERDLLANVSNENSSGTTLKVCNVFFRFERHRMFLLCVF
ncbi:putative HAT dimerization domain, ribonuclease H-like superfamily [Helianthus annuus]|nr:putative HAT dimerization domain, ribonuclease H-like superfamily [Helianthus annuus]